YAKLCENVPWISLPGRALYLHWLRNCQGSHASDIKTFELVERTMWDNDCCKLTNFKGGTIALRKTLKKGKSPRLLVTGFTPFSEGKSVKNSGKKSGIYHTK